MYEEFLKSFQMQYFHYHLKKTQHVLYIAVRVNKDLDLTFWQEYGFSWNVRLKSRFLLYNKGACFSFL